MRSVRLHTKALASYNLENHGPSKGAVRGAGGSRAGVTTAGVAPKVLLLAVEDVTRPW